MPRVSFVPSIPQKSVTVDFSNVMTFASMICSMAHAGDATEIAGQTQLCLQEATHPAHRSLGMFAAQAALWQRRAMTPNTSAQLTDKLLAPLLDAERPPTPPRPQTHRRSWVPKPPGPIGKATAALPSFRAERDQFSAPPESATTSNMHQLSGMGENGDSSEQMGRQTDKGKDGLAMEYEQASMPRLVRYAAMQPAVHQSSS